MENEECSCVARIVNLHESLTEETLKVFILNNCQPMGSVKKIYLKKHNEDGIIYSYVVFENSYDASKMVRLLNQRVYKSKKFEVELIGPNLKYHIYVKDKKDTLKESTSGAVPKYHLPTASGSRLPVIKRKRAHSGSRSKVDGGYNNKRAMKK